MLRLTLLVLIASMLPRPASAEEEHGPHADMNVVGFFVGATTKFKSRVPDKTGTTVAGEYEWIPAKWDHRWGFGGAIEIIGRVSGLDLNDGLITGGEIFDVSVGLNWYLSHASRVMANYIYSDVEGVGHAHILLLRYQFNP